MKSETEIYEMSKRMQEKYNRNREELRNDHSGFDQEFVDAHLKELKKLRAEIPQGAWSNEPDRVEFTHEGFACLIQRGPLMAWCGYVGLPPEHPFYGKNYQDIDGDENDIPSHGGLTYSEPCHGTVCHKTETADRLWWLGFDCGHAGDLIPGMLKYDLPSFNNLTFFQADKYRNQYYVTYVVKELAEWAKGATK